jgi:WhiB family redox-sensing transcriptional regulator
MIMPTYRGWMAGQLQLFIPTDRGRAWTGYVTPPPVVHRIAAHVRITRADLAYGPLTSTNGSNISRVVEYQPPAELDDWRDRAACRVDLGVDPELFFPPNGARTDLESPAKEACNACPVQSDCLEWALESRQRFGIWGGKTRHERRRIARERAIALGKASAVNKDEAQEWLRKNASDPFVIAQIGDAVVGQHVGPGDEFHPEFTWEEGARRAMLALADMLDEADS